LLAIPSDGELVRYAAATYLPEAQPFIEDIDHSIRVFLTTRQDGLNVFAIEGTHSPLGWALDFFGLRTEDQQGFEHATLGWLHGGFYDAAVAALPRLALEAVRGPYVITGHSLGAALALLIGGLLIQDEKLGVSHPIKICAFAPPRVGGKLFVETVMTVPLSAYRFGNDPVPEIPIALPGFPYEQVPLIEIGSPKLDPFACHSIANYVAAVPK